MVGHARPEQQAEQVQYMWAMDPEHDAYGALLVLAGSLDRDVMDFWRSR